MPQVSLRGNPHIPLIARIQVGVRVAGLAHLICGDGIRDPVVVRWVHVMLGCRLELKMFGQRGNHSGLLEPIG